MAETRTVYHITAWEWNAGTKEYDPVILAIYEDFAPAREAFDNAIVCNDTPQIDFCEVVYDRKGCRISTTAIDRKD